MTSTPVTSTTDTSGTPSTVGEPTSSSVPACGSPQPGLPLGIDQVLDCASLVYYDDLATFEVSQTPTSSNWWAGSNAYLGESADDGQVFDTSQVIPEQSGITSNQTLSVGQAAVFEYSFTSEGVFDVTILRGEWSSPDYRSWAIYMTPSGPTVVATAGPNDATNTCCDDVMGGPVSSGRYYVMVGLSATGEMIGAYWPADGAAAPITRLDDIGVPSGATWSVNFHVWQLDDGAMVTLHSFALISHAGLIS
ncbi:MAG: hypothetical protein ABL953_03770 [Ilumatobacteraceae bacterium]